jgi:hypothetical protein
VKVCGNKGEEKIINMRVLLKMIKNKDLVYIVGKMDGVIKDILLMI